METFVTFHRNRKLLFKGIDFWLIKSYNSNNADEVYEKAIQNM